jgi:hypothetical protein
MKCGSEFEISELNVNYVTSLKTYNYKLTTNAEVK